MKRITLVSICVVLAGAVLSCQPAATPPVANENKPAASPAAKSAAGAPDFEAIANRVVTQVAGVKEGDVVFEIAGKPPGDDEAFRKIDQVPMVVERDGKRLEVEVAQVVLVE